MDASWGARGGGDCGAGAGAGLGVGAPAADWQEEIREEVRRSRGGAAGRASLGAAPLAARPGALGAVAGRAGVGGGGGSGRPQSANKAFLERYSLGNSGLFAPL